MASGKILFFTNLDEYYAICKDLENAMARMEAYKIKTADGDEKLLIPSHQSLSFVLVDKDDPSLHRNIPDPLL